MTTKKRKSKYAPEVKESIIKLYQTGRSTTSLVKEYPINVSTVCKWVQQASKSQDSNIISVKERELIMENKRLKEELDILKRATVILAKD